MFQSFLNFQQQKQSSLLDSSLIKLTKMPFIQDNYTFLRIFQLLLLSCLLLKNGIIHQKHPPQSLKYNTKKQLLLTLFTIIQNHTKSTMLKRSLYLITGNQKKLQEFTHILGNEFDFKTENVDLPELQGEPEEVAIQKARIAFQQTKKPVLVQDTSLCFNAYKGLPGPYIKWFLKNVGPEGLAKMVEPFPDKTGYAMCIIAYMSPELEKPQLFIGRTPGTIVEPRGSRDFGWDPVFQPEGYDQTYAELPKEIKNKISHRFRAIDAMREFFRAQQK